MKKILTILILIITIISSIGICSARCEISAGAFDQGSAQTVSGALDRCMQGANVINGTDASIETGAKNLINGWVKNIGMVLGLLAVGSIVYGSLLMTLSTGEDEKIKKAKDVIKWGIIGFLGLIFASSIILLVVNIMYSIEV